MQDGTSKGNEPAVKVLEIAQHQDRKADDLLPYLGPFAKLFRTLPKSPKDLILKTAFVPLNDIECFTKTIIDVPDSVQNLNRKKGEYFFCKMDRVANLCDRHIEAGSRSVLALVSIVALRRLG